MYRTHVLPNGRVVKHGLNVRQRNPDQSNAPQGGLYRGVVLETYATDDPVRTENNEGTKRVYEVECDVILARAKVTYRRVPVMQISHGRNNAAPWVPKASTAVVGGGELNLRRMSRRGSPEAPPPNLEDLNGDQVIVQFIEGDPEYPIITGALSHANTTRRVVDGEGWSESAGGNANGDVGKFERYSRFGGTELRVNSSGDVLIDTEEANPLDEDTEAPDVNGGAARVRLKRGQVLTIEAGGVDLLEVYSDLATGEPHIDLGEGASERLVRGNRLVAWLAAHIHPTGAGPAGPPPPAAGGETIEPIASNASFLSRQHKIENSSDGELP